MKCTVITPCYNPGSYLMPMLESVAIQHQYVEKHIIMDGGSTDGTIAILSRWVTDHPWVEFVSERDRGQADACRKALERVKTDYFFWLNADDVMLEGALKHLLSVAERNPRPAIVYGDYLRIDGAGFVYAERRQPSFNYWDCLHGYITVQNVAAIFNTEQLRAAGGFDVTLQFVMDYDIVLKLGRRGEVRHINTFCGAFRVHAASKTTTINEVCQRETEALRIRYGVSENVWMRKILFGVTKIRVYWRMLLEGCMKGRLYK